MTIQTAHTEEKFSNPANHPKLEERAGNTDSLAQSS